MRIMLNIVSVIIILIAGLLFTAAACNLAIISTFFNRATYEKSLQDEIVFQNVLSMALPVLVNFENDEINFDEPTEFPVAFRDVALALQTKPEVWNEITTLLVPGDWLQTTTRQFFDIFFEMMKGSLSSIEQEIDVTEVRQRLLGTQAQQAANLIINEAPVCNAEQEQNLRAFIAQEINTLPICKPTDESLYTTSVQTVNGWFTDIADQLAADQVSFSQLFNISRDNAREIQLGISLLNQGRFLPFLCASAFFSVVVILVVRSLGSFSRWIGSASIIIGVFSLLIILFTQIIGFGVISELFTNNTTPTQLFGARLLSAFILSVVSQYSTALLVQAAFFVGFGFFWIALAWYLARNSDDDGSLVLITEDGEIISTATQQKIGTIAQQQADDQ